MKVAQLLPELNFGGVERGTVDLANFLVSQDHDALVISAGGVLEGELTLKNSTCGNNKSIMILRN